VVGERFVQVVAQVPAMCQVEAGDLDELELEEDHRIDAGAATITVACLDPVADKAEVEGSFEMAVEVIGGDEPFERNQDGAIQVPLFGRTEHAADETF